MTAPAAPVVAVVPLRDGVSGKSRLATALAPAQRRRLIVTLARHVVATLTTDGLVSRVVVVTADPPFAAQALAGLDTGRVPVAVLPQPETQPGLNAALDLARERIRRESPGATLLVAHADLPSLTSDDVAAVLAAARDGARDGVGDGARAGAGVAIATDRHDAGTNLLALPADAPFDFQFGVGSRAAHEAQAARHGLRAVVVRRPGAAADLDTIDDWDGLPATTRARLAG
ncbi:2-phospho-L-lactate guanylyltransferase [Xylanimonas ulmi]|uniref:Phosphoenolpyruvate guanylyltransferase n=1 Tax=Xylanimonas ulmi TaxID=228973 RepID=A0A4Q7M3P5_9MICO|nr:2-phospho-L-lactate guanylyltransferase [Xylanibacterium ulmi]RZS62164.1 2-phospho-L-lactate guanylyltransferase [Xylanibacterium ulmi]